MSNNQSKIDIKTSIVMSNNVKLSFAEDWKN